MTAARPTTMSATTGPGRRGSELWPMSDSRLEAVSAGWLR